MPKGNKVSRTRNYATVVYPESAPVNWLDILKSLHIPFFVSPLHDRDISADGSPKKPHYHVLIMFESVKTNEQAADIFVQIGGVGLEVINSLRSYARYLCHLDDPDKAQYYVEDVISGSGADYLTIINTLSDKFLIIRQMMGYVKEHHVLCYCDLVDYAAENNDLWFDALTTSCSYFLREYVKSYAFKWKKDNENVEND